MSQSSTPAVTDAIYDASSLGRPRMFVLGLQHMFAMFGATVLVPVLTGLSVSATLLFAGIGTLLFHFLSRGKVPAFLGSSFAFIAGYAAIAPNGEAELLPYACLGVACAGLLYPVLAALVITLVDALPVFGTGTILIPWALALFLRGETKTGIGLVILYGAAALSRQALEPRLVGKQVGLNPVLTLLALYTGYRLLGVGGMIVFPIAAMLFKQLWDHSGLQPDG